MSPLYDNASRLERRGSGFLQPVGGGIRGYFAGVQLSPWLVVVNLRPSAVVTVAEDALRALIATKSSRSGGEITRQFDASSVTRMIPSSPASQQTFALGAEPATKCAFGLGNVPFHVAPPSSDRSMNPPLAIRHKIFESGVVMMCAGETSPAWFAVTISARARKVLTSAGASFAFEDCVLALTAPETTPPTAPPLLCGGAGAVEAGEGAAAAPATAGVSDSTVTLSVVAWGTDAFET